MVGPSINTHNFTSKPSSSAIKLLCSYGGKILPRYPDGKLRYHGGETRVLAVERSISFAELLVKLGEMCGASMSLRCQLPNEDLDALVSVTSDEDLANLIEEYDRAAPPDPAAPIKIRAFLYPPKFVKKVSPPLSTASSSSSSNDATSPKISTCPFSTVASMCSGSRPTASERSPRYVSRPRVFPWYYEKAAGKLPQFAYNGHGNANNSHVYLIHNGNHWQ